MLVPVLTLAAVAALFFPLRAALENPQGIADSAAVVCLALAAVSLRFANVA